MGLLSMGLATAFALFGYRVMHSTSAAGAQTRSDRSGGRQTPAEDGEAGKWGQKNLIGSAEPVEGRGVDAASSPERTETRDYTADMKVYVWKRAKARAPFAFMPLDQHAKINPRSNVSRCILLPPFFCPILLLKLPPSPCRPPDAKLLHPAAQRAGIEVENLRGAAISFDHPVCLCQDRLNVPSLDVFQGTILIRDSRGDATLTGLDFGFRNSEFRMSLLASAAVG